MESHSIIGLWVPNVNHVRLRTRILGEWSYASLLPIIGWSLLDGNSPIGCFCHGDVVKLQRSPENCAGGQLPVIANTVDLKITHRTSSLFYTTYQN